MFVQTASRIAPVARTAVSILQEKNLKLSIQHYVVLLCGEVFLNSDKWIAFVANIKCFDGYERKLLIMTFV